MQHRTTHQRCRTGPRRGEAHVMGACVRCLIILTNAWALGSAPRSSSKPTTAALSFCPQAECSGVKPFCSPCKTNTNTHTHTYAQTNPSVNPTNQSITQPAHPHPLQTPTSPPPNHHNNKNNNTTTSALCSTTPHINDAEQALGGVKRMWWVHV